MRNLPDFIRHTHTFEQAALSQWSFDSIISLLLV